MNHRNLLGDLQYWILFLGIVILPPVLLLLLHDGEILSSCQWYPPSVHNCTMACTFSVDLYRVNFSRSAFSADPSMIRVFILS